MEMRKRGPQRNKTDSPDCASSHQVQHQRATERQWSGLGGHTGASGHSSTGTKSHWEPQTPKDGQLALHKCLLVGKALQAIVE